MQHKKYLIKLIAVILIVVFAPNVYGQSNKIGKTTITPMRVKYSRQRLKEFERLIVEKGDSNAYYEYIHSRFSIDCLPYALIMANKYNYARANDDVYNFLFLAFQNANSKMDSITLDFAMKHLERGSDMGDEGCSHSLYVIYAYGKENIPIDTIKARKYFFRYFDNYTEADWASEKREIEQRMESLKKAK
jgi:hypothetical protein